MPALNVPLGVTGSSRNSTSIILSQTHDGSQLKPLHPATECLLAALPAVRPPGNGAVPDAQAMRRPPHHPHHHLKLHIKRNLPYYTQKPHSVGAGPRAEKSTTLLSSSRSRYGDFEVVVVPQCKSPHDGRTRVDDQRVPKA